MDVSSIAAYATSLSQAQLQQDVGTRVAKKTLDAAKQQGQAALSLLDAAAQVQKKAAVQSLEPHKGVHLNVLA